ncbi:hypothetical protein IQ273_28805 [Nodosilinea sp. LEGE 07298]|uniref:hypothetical protein n=1 Tax=Nodosilinea sp. LEGE 07298 TaxID=2777970 RepID=UPI0018811A0F|nr:hypothetical protein [Nodosilinea sp. LEGE 07298]MBE9113382.1 hypothetical protein [Nodosilinea sp. LEGE 07298]
MAAAALLWSSPSSAQGYCYLVNSDGQVVNLDDLCQSNNDSQSVQPQPAASGVGEAATEAQGGTSSGVRSYTITGPAAVPGSSADPAGSAVDQPGTAERLPGAIPGTTERLPEATPGTTTTPTDVNDATTETGTEAGTEPRTEENRLDIPVREIETPQIPTPQIQPPRVTTPEAQDPTIDTTDTPNRRVNGTVIRGTDRIVVPSNQEPGN